MWCHEVIYTHIYIYIYIYIDFVLDFAVGTNRHPKQRYYSSVFYKSKHPHEWDIQFVITKDDPAFQKVNYLHMPTGTHLTCCDCTSYSSLKKSTMNGLMMFIG